MSRPQYLFSFKFYFWAFLICSVVQTEECMDSFDFEMAGLFCQRALDVEPTNLQVLDMQGHIYSELGNTQKAKEISFLTAFMSVI